MPKIDPKAEYRVAKNWANANVLFAVLIALAVGVAVGLVIG